MTRSAFYPFIASSVRRGAYCHRCEAGDKRGSGNDIHDRRVWNRRAAYAEPDPPDALPVNASIRPVNRLISNHGMQIKTAA
jgi:hypothetical protein